MPVTSDRIPVVRCRPKIDLRKVQSATRTKLGAVFVHLRTPRTSHSDHYDGPQTPKTQASRRTIKDMRPQRPNRADTASRRPGCAGGRLGMALVLVVVALVGYFGSSQVNPVTGKKQYVALSPDQEIALGLQAAPEMAAQHQGAESGRDAEYVRQIGRRLVEQSEARKSGYPFDFHLLADPQLVNAFALPGGQIFITRALYDRLETEGQLAGVLGHEIGHVIERHGAQQMAVQQRNQGLVAAAATATENPAALGTIAQYVANFTQLKYGRDDELESDAWGIQIMVDAGYDPRALIGVMRILEEAAGGASQPEWLSTHPNPGNRIQKIETQIKTLYPQGLPPNLTP